MPYEFEDVAKEVSQGAKDVKKQLDEIVESAEDADKAYAKLTKTQQAAIRITEKFDKAMKSANKGIILFGHTGMSAVRGIKAIDTTSRSAASSLAAIGAGASAASAGLKTLSGQTGSLSSDVIAAERSIAGLVKGVGGLASKLDDLPKTKVPVSVVIGSLKPLDDLEVRLVKIAKPVQVKISVPTSAMKAPTALPAPVRDAHGLASAIGGPRAGRKAAEKAGKIIGRVYGEKFSKALGREKVKDPFAELGRRGMSERMWDYFDKGLRHAEDELERLEDELEGITDKKRYIQVSVKIAQLKAAQNFFSNMEKSPKEKGQIQDTFERLQRFGNDYGIRWLADKFPEFGFKLAKSMGIASKEAGRMTSQMSQLQRQIDKNVQSVGDLVKRQEAMGGREFGELADGMGASAKGMLAAGLAVYFVAGKVAELSSKFTDAAISLRKYKVETSALERQIIGFNKGALEAMRKQLSLTREQATAFFSVVKDATNTLGISRNELMRVSQALQETFGGDQTDRLKSYIDLLKEMPTAGIDLRVTANPDDQAAALFGLAKAGKMDIVMDLQTAGVFGGPQQKQSGADQLNLAQRTAAATEGIKDFLIDKLYPDVGPILGAIAENGLKLIAAVGGVVSFMGAMQMAFVKEQALTTATVAEGDAAIIAAIYNSAATQAAISGIGKQGAGSLIGKAEGAATTAAAKTTGKMATQAGKAAVGLGKLAKGVTIVTLAAVAVDIGMGMLADHLEKGGNDVGAATAKLSGSIASVAGWAATGFGIGALFGGIGAPIGAAIGAIIGLAVEFGNLKRSVTTLWQALKKPPETPFTKLTQTMLAYDNEMRKSQERTMQSGMALQQSMERTKAAFNSLKMEIYETEKRIAMLQFENLKNIGGTADAFNSAVGDATRAVTMEFQERTKAMAEERRRILNDGKMEAAQRQAALRLVHEKEMEATKEFISGVQEVVNALFETPAIIQAGMRAKIKQSTLELVEEYGGGGAGFEKLGEDAMAELGKRFTGVMDASIEAAKTTQAEVLELEKQKEVKLKAIGDRIAENAEKNFKAGEDAVKARRIEVAAAKAAVPSAKQAAEAEKKLADLRSEGANWTKAKAGMAATAVGAGVAGVMGPAGGMMSEIAALKAWQAQVDAATRAVNDIKNKQMEANSAQTELDVELEKQKALKDQQASLESVLTDAAKKARDEAAKRGEKYEFKATDVDEGKVMEQLKSAQARAKNLDSQISESRKKIAGQFSQEQGQAMVQVSKQLKEAEAIAQRDAEKMEKLKGKKTGGKEMRDAESEAKKSGEEVMKLKAQQESLIENVAEQISKSMPKIDKTTAKNVAKELAGAEGGMDDWDRILQKIPGLTEEVRKQIDAVVAESRNLRKLEAMRDGLAGVIDPLREIANINDGITAILNNQLKNTEEINQAARDLLERQDRIWRSFNDTVKKQQRLVKVQDYLATLATMTGTGTEERAKLAEEQVRQTKMEHDAYMESVAAMEASLPAWEEQLKNLEKQAEVAKQQEAAMAKGSDAQKQAAKSAREDAENRATAARAVVEGTKKHISEATEAANQVIQKLPMVGESITQAIQDLDRSLSGVRVQNMKDLSEALLEAAEYGGTVAEAETKSFEIAKKAADERYEMEKKEIARRQKAEQESIEARVSAEANAAKQAALGRGATPQQAEEEAKQVSDRVKAEAQATLESKNRLENAKTENKHKREVVEAAKRSKELREREIGIQQGLIDDALSFATEFGGSFSSIMALQTLNVQLARQQVESAKEIRDRLEEAGVGGQEMLDAQRNYATAMMNLRRKELGIQKDIVDRMLGAAFGGLRESFGARRQVGSDVALLGLARTRMKTATGRYIEVPPGAPTTIAQRQMQRARGGIPEMGKEDRVLAEVAKALGMSPARAKMEKDIQDKMGKTEKNTGNTADNTAPGRTRGSLFVHDEYAQSYLASILSVLKDIASLWSGSNAPAGGKADAKEAVAEMEKKAKAAGDESRARSESLEKQMATTQTVAKKGAESYEKVSSGIIPERAKEMLDAVSTYTIAATDKTNAEKTAVKAVTGRLAGTGSARLRGGPFAETTGATRLRGGPFAGMGASSRLRGGPFAGGDWTKLQGGPFGGVGGLTLNGGPFGGMPTGQLRTKTALPGGTVTTGGAVPGKAIVPGGTVTAAGGAVGSPTVSARPAGTSAAAPVAGAMGERAAGTAIAPPTVGMRMMAGGPGGGGATAAEQVTFKVTGEMLVKFDNKMLKSVLTPVVGEIIGNVENRKKMERVLFT